MVILGLIGGEVEVRLVKPPFDAKESERVYFDEYEKLGTAHPGQDQLECSRYLAAENSPYAVEVTLKKRLQSRGI